MAKQGGDGYLGITIDFSRSEHLRLDRLGVLYSGI